MEKQLKTLTGPSWSGVRYFTTQLNGGLSQGDWAGLNLGAHCGDRPEHVEQNRQLLATCLPSTPHWLQQVHGTQLYQALKPSPQAYSWEQAPIADAAWTTKPRVVLAILTADCLPVVIADKAGTVVGIAHAGWRGLAAGVLEKLFLQLEQQAGTPCQWQAWIGPAISQPYFEVGSEVLDIFIKKNNHFSYYFKPKETPGKYQMDLAGIAKKTLSLIARGNIEITLSNACTFSEPQHYYSYRKKAKTGRIATIVYID